MARWTDAFVGEEFGPQEFHLTEKLHRRYIDGTRNDQPVHADVCRPVGSRELRDLRPGGPVSRADHPHAPGAPVLRSARVGETVIGTGVLALKEMRRDKAYVAIDCDFKRGDELVWQARMTCIWPEVHLRGEV